MPALKEFPPLEFTSNNLADVIKFIKDGNIVVLHTTEESRIFNTCLSDSSNLELSKKELENIRVIYVDCNKMPGLLEQGEWEYFINREATSAKDDKILRVEDQFQLKNEVGMMLIEQKLVPNKAYLRL